MLAVAAGFVVWQGYIGAGPSAVGWLAGLSAAQVVGLVVGLTVFGVLAIQGLFLLKLLRQNGRLLLRVEALEGGLGGEPSGDGEEAEPPAGLPIGDSAPEFELPGLEGERLTLESLRASEKPVMLLFTDPECYPCTAMLPEIGRWQKEHAGELTVSLVSRGTVEENRAKSSEHGLSGVLLQRDWEVSEAYGVDATPSAVLIRPDGTIGSSVHEGQDEISALLAHAVEERARLHAAVPTVPSAKKIDEPAPEVKLPDLAGNTVELKDFRGEETLVLFWNPGCGFCQQILPDLKEWEANVPEGAPRLLFVSLGTMEANSEMGLRSTVVLDQQFSGGRAFGASGTPAAVLVDAEGKIASELAVGGPAVLELARGNRAAA